MTFHDDTLQLDAEENGTMENVAPDSLAIEVDSSIGKFCIACVYRSPNLNSILNSALLTCINDICNESNSFETVLLGDINLPDISWETGSLKNCNSSTQNKFLLQQLEFIDAFRGGGANGEKWPMMAKNGE